MDNRIMNFLCSPELIDKISDITRIVDPVQKKVIEYRNNTETVDSFHCFDFWGNHKVCDNCISMRAFNENSAYVKIEYKKEKTFLITAVPYTLPDRRIIIEIIKDITKSFVFDLDENNPAEQTGIHTLIDSMNKLAFNDALTGLYNRRYIMEKLPVDILNSALLSTDLTVIMADIDLFKNVNDIYGHLAGDHTLKKVAEVLSSCIKRANDWVARFGGEEFLICMSGASIETAIKTAENMRMTLENTAIRYEDKEFKVTASFGVNCTKTPGKMTADDLIKNADDKLYLAKKNGRNRVEY